MKKYPTAWLLTICLGLFVLSAGCKNAENKMTQSYRPSAPEQAVSAETTAPSETAGEETTQEPVSE